MTTMTTTFNTKNRIDFLFIYDCLDGNPNGDPNMDNLPRQDPETGHGLVSDVCIKRRIRDYVEQKGTRIYVKAGTAMDETRGEAYQALGIDEAKKKKKDVSIDGLRDHMCKTFYDIRTFGAVMSQKQNNCGQVRGPVQITFSRSVDPIQPMSHAITVCAAQTAEEGKENQSMGRKTSMPYGCYIGRGFYSPALAAKTGFNGDDFDLLMEALLNMFEHDHSASRGTITMRKIVIFQHSTPLGNYRAAELFDSVKLTKKVGMPRNWSDYELTIRSVEGVTTTVLG